MVEIMNLSTFLGLRNAALSLGSRAVRSYFKNVYCIDAIFHG